MAVAGVIPRLSGISAVPCALRAGVKAALCTRNVRRVRGCEADACACMCGLLKALGDAPWIMQPGTTTSRMDRWTSMPIHGPYWHMRTSHAPRMTSTFWVSPSRVGGCMPGCVGQTRTVCVKQFTSHRHARTSTSTLTTLFSTYIAAMESLDLVQRVRSGIARGHRSRTTTASGRVTLHTLHSNMAT